MNLIIYSLFVLLNSFCYFFHYCLFPFSFYDAGIKWNQLHTMIVGPCTIDGYAIRDARVYDVMARFLFFNIEYL